MSPCIIRANKMKTVTLADQKNLAGDLLVKCMRNCMSRSIVSWQNLANSQLSMPVLVVPLRFVDCLEIPFTDSVLVPAPCPLHLNNYIHFQPGGEAWV